MPDLAASFQDRIAGILAEKLLLAAADTGAKQVCLQLSPPTLDKTDSGTCGPQRPGNPRRKAARPQTRR